jgi:hypothetical protein
MKLCQLSKKVFFIHKTTTYNLHLTAILTFPEKIQTLTKRNKNKIQVHACEIPE